MPKYIVGLREVHVSLVEVNSDTPLEEYEIIHQAKQKHENLDTLNVEFSHVMPDEHHTIEEVDE